MSGGINDGYSQITTQDNEPRLWPCACCGKPVLVENNEWVFSTTICPKCDWESQSAVIEKTDGQKLVEFCDRMMGCES